MRARVIGSLVLAGAVGAVAAVLIGASGDGREPAVALVPRPRTVPAAVSLPPRSVSAGAVNVWIEPLRLDASGAVFRVELDTHSVELSVALERSATLEVGGRAWGPATWSGSGPGGHHRGGELRFRAGGPLTGSVHLVIGGLPEPVEGHWEVGG